MAYTHSKYEVQMVPVNRTISASGAATTFNNIQIDVTGLAARWSCGFVPHLIKGAAVIRSATVQPDAAISLSFRADLTTPGTPTNLFTIVIPTVAAIHKSVYYRPTYDIEIKPGQRVIMHVTAAATSTSDADVVLYVQARWEEPGNVTSMLKTT